MTALVVAAAAAALAHCAVPAVPPEAAKLLSAVRSVESGREPYTVSTNDKGGGHRHFVFQTEPAAIAMVEALSREGRAESIDAGIAQINSRNWSRLGLSLGTVFDPCRNVVAEARVLSEDWRRAARVTLSYYNTGTSDRGIANGYADRVLQAMGDERPSTPDRSPKAVSACTPPDPTGWRVSITDCEKDTQNGD